MHTRTHRTYSSCACFAERACVCQWSGSRVHLKAPPRCLITAERGSPELSDLLRPRHTNKQARLLLTYAVLGKIVPCAYLVNFKLPNEIEY